MFLQVLFQVIMSVISQESRESAMTSGPLSGYTIPELLEKKRGLQQANNELRVERNQIRNSDWETSSQMAQLITINYQEINEIREELDSRAARRAEREAHRASRSARGDR